MTGLRPLPGHVRADAQRIVGELRAADDATLAGALYDAGLAWVHFPLGRGGRGLPAGLQAEVDDELAAAGRTLDWERNPMGIGMVAPALVGHGTDEQQEHLRDIWTAAELWCQLFSEPGAGSDLASLTTRAVRDGAGWRVNGQKVWTSLAHRARYGLLLARTDPDAPKHAGLTAFVVDMSAPGVLVRPLRDLTGATHFNEVFLDDVFLADEARIGAPGDGWRVAITMLMNERTIIGGAVGDPGTGAIAHAVAAFERHAGDDPVLRRRLAWLWTEAESVRLMAAYDRTDRAAGTTGPAGSMLKLARAELDQRIARFALDVSGVAALRCEVSVADGPDGSDAAVTREWLRSQAYTIAGGTSDILRTIIAERVLGLPRAT